MIQTYTVHFGKRLDGRFSVHYESSLSYPLSQILQDLASAERLIRCKLGPDPKPNRRIDLTQDQIRSWNDKRSRQKDHDLLYPLKKKNPLDLDDRETQDKIGGCQKHRDSCFRDGHTASDRLDDKTFNQFIKDDSYGTFDSNNKPRRSENDHDLIFYLKKKNPLDLDDRETTPIRLPSNTDTGLDNILLQPVVDPDFSRVLGSVAKILALHLRLPYLRHTSFTPQVSSSISGSDADLVTSFFILYNAARTVTKI
ncbi:MAG TPA: hypothetical protein VJH37_05310 [Candidatus Nanoarchaeia archaeon]|nr:hypothetical protein [Candidatus Nanoarchaeia archaeon]